MASQYSYDHLKHRLGDPSYDADMDIVESFVNAHRYPEDILAQQAVHSYYIGKLSDYWTKTALYFRSGNIEDEIKRHPRAFFGFKPENVAYQFIESYQPQFQALLHQLQSNFERTHRLDVKSIKRAFNFIATIACARTPTDFDPIGLDDPQAYILPNEIGFFGLNTYLYALFENIMLVGAPLKLSFFDRVAGCPADFIYHDFGHNRAFKESMELLDEQDWTQLKNFYYTILNDQNLELQRKQCLILFLWIELHEFGTNSLSTQIQSLYFLEYLERSLEQLLKYSLAKEFDQEVIKFGSFIFEYDNIATLSDLIRKLEPLAQSRSQKNLINRYLTRIEKISAMTPVDPRENKFLYYLMSYWYYFRYVIAYNQTLHP